MRSTLAAIRVADPTDVARIARIVNSAFAIETFLEGPRTNEEQLTRMMQKGNFLLGCDTLNRILSSVYVELRTPRGYLGMLSVDPEHQGTGLGQAMVKAAEDFCREQGCDAMDLTILSLRPELFPFYRKLGYTETGIEEFIPGRPFKAPTSCHCIVLSKAL